MPLLGICRGIQLLNVAAGGTLWQDIPSQCPQALRHMDDGHGRERRRLLHSVEVAPTSAAAGLLGGGALPVNSIHHQAVRRVAPGLRVAAMAPDGIVEAIEVPGHPFAMAVQWHPEDLWIQDRRQAALFAGFCDAARAAVSPT
jgi:putative glutamine amidotransferase